MTFPALLTLAFSALAIAPPRRPPVPATVNQDPHFSCQIERRGADGVVSLSRLVSPSGAAGPSIAMWTKEFGPDGVLLFSAWNPPAPIESSLIQIFYQNADPRRAYRFRLQRSVPNGGSRRLFQSGLLRRPDGFLQFSIRWGQLSHMLAGAAEPSLLIVRGDGRAVRSDPVDPAILGRVVAAAASLRPALDAMIADYRSRCPFIQPGVVY